MANLLKKNLFNKSHVLVSKDLNRLLALKETIPRVLKADFNAVFNEIQRQS